MRQANQIALRQRLAEARAAQDRPSLAIAAKLYDAAWTSSQDWHRAMSSAEAAPPVAGLAAVRLDLAREAQRHSDYREASTQINDVLRVDPMPRPSISSGPTTSCWPSSAAMFPTPNTRPGAGIVEEKINANTLVHDGSVLFEMGKMKEAEANLKEAAQTRPAKPGRPLLSQPDPEAEFKHACQNRRSDDAPGPSHVEQAWAPRPSATCCPSPIPTPAPIILSTPVLSPEHLSKLDRIRLDNVKYDGLPLSEVIINLNDEAKRRDPEKRGINFIVNQNVDTGGAAAAAAPAVGPDGQSAPGRPARAVDMCSISIKIIPALTDVRLADVLDAIVKVADRPIKYSIEDYAIVFSLKAREAVPLYIRTFKVDPNTFYQGLQGVGSTSFGQSYNVGNSSSGGGGGGGSFGGGGGGGLGGGGGGGGFGGGGQQGGGQGGGLGGGGQGGIGAIIARVSVTGGGVGGGIGGQQGLGGGGGGGLKFVTSTNNMADVSHAAANYFEGLGVDLDPIRNPGKSVFFNDRQGMLLVRATLQDSRYH